MEFEQLAIVNKLHVSVFTLPQVYGAVDWTCVVSKKGIDPVRVEGNNLNDVKNQAISLALDKLRAINQLSEGVVGSDSPTPTVENGTSEHTESTSDIDLRQCCV